MAKERQLLPWIISLAFVCTSQGLQMSMDRIPGKDPCGHIRCWNQVTPDGNIFSTTGISIYDVTQPGNKLKLATISSNGAGLLIDTTKVNDVNGTGTISRYSANLDLDFHNETDCLSGSFECELEFVSMDGKLDTAHQTAAPGNSCSCALLSYQLSKLTARLDDVEKELTFLRLTQTAQGQDLVTLRQHNAILETRIDSLYNHVSVTQPLPTSPTVLPVTSITSAVVPPVTGITSSALKTTCSRGPFINPREKFLLWGTIPALCDMETDGGGWVIIQRRTKGDMDFYRGWNDYKIGFGTPETDFWIGNDIIHNLTSQGYNELRIDMALEGHQYFAHYSTFNIDHENLNYKLTVGGYSGSAGNSLSNNNGMMFSTFDRDNDRDFWNCASHLTSAWWYDSCYYVNLNGIWGKNDDGGVIWDGIDGYKSLSFTEMKIRHSQTG